MKSRFLLPAILAITLSACITPVPFPVVVDEPAPNSKSDSKGSSSGDIITVPAIIIGTPKPKENSVYVCTMSAFTSTYIAENTNRGKARLDVKKQCLKNFHEMHCSDEKITCKEY